ncbi:hypothetical protein JT55_19280 [Rhodovulum sp. NI22]|jgi:hypothetical protein|nr:hypothetical protein JT55_19280 [Rhodovulum sp. NI22]
MVVTRARARAILGAVALVALAACAGTQPGDPLEPPALLGDFRLGHNIVVADEAQKLPPSRKATADEWEAAVKTEVERRFGRYEGEKIYHIGVRVDGYALAVPGIPIILSPKSALVFTVNIWDDAAGQKLNAKPEQIAVLESVTGKTLVGSGLTRSREEQMQDLAQNAAKAIERWLVKNRADWFGQEEPEPVAEDAAAGGGEDA